MSKVPQDQSYEIFKICNFHSYTVVKQHSQKLLYVPPNVCLFTQRTWQRIFNTHAPLPVSLSANIRSFWSMLIICFDNDGGLVL